MTKKQIIISIIAILLVGWLITSFFLFGKIFADKDSSREFQEQEKIKDNHSKEENSLENEETNLEKDVKETGEDSEENKKDSDEIKKDENKKASENTKKDNQVTDNKTANKEENKTSNNQNKDTNTNNTKPSTPSSNKDNENNKPSDNNNFVEKPKEENDEVDTLRKKIENTYGITIKYGNELGSYRPKRLTPTILNDKEKIKKELNLINNELKKYPTGFFRDFSGMPLTIYLVSSVPGNVFSGFTDREFMSDIKITLTENYFFEYTLNHELMHYIDAYLEIKMYPANPYDEYMALNPLDFNYGTINKNYNYGNNGVIKGAYFIDDYAQSSVREDRAELFKNMITRLYKPAGMFDNGEILQKKALIIDKQIRQYFKSANGTTYWDKIIGK